MLISTRGSVDQSFEREGQVSYWSLRQSVCSRSQWGRGNSLGHSSSHQSLVARVVVHHCPWGCGGWGGFGQTLGRGTNYVNRVDQKEDSGTSSQIRRQLFSLQPNTLLSPGSVHVSPRFVDFLLHGKGKGKGKFVLASCGVSSNKLAFTVTQASSASLSVSLPLNIAALDKHAHLNFRRVTSSQPASGAKNTSQKVELACWDVSIAIGKRQIKHIERSFIIWHSVFGILLPFLPSWLSL